ELVRQVEALEPERAAAGRAVLRIARVERPAGRADADDPPLVQMQQVVVLVADREAAELAARLRRPGGGRRRALRTADPPERRHHRGALGADGSGGLCPVPAHAARATRAEPSSRRSGTGSSWSPSPSSARPASGSE